MRLCDSPGLSRCDCYTFRPPVQPPITSLHPPVDSILSFSLPSLLQHLLLLRHFLSLLVWASVPPRGSPDLRVSFPMHYRFQDGQLTSDELWHNHEVLIGTHASRQHGTTPLHKLKNVLDARHDHANGDDHAHGGHAQRPAHGGDQDHDEL